MATLLLLATACSAPDVDFVAVTNRPSCPPLRVAVFQDLSASTPTNGIPRLRSNHLQQLLDRISVCGGELALGTINDSSDRPLIRVRIDGRPLPLPDLVLRGTAFEQARLREDHAEATEQYHLAVEASEAEAARRMAAFLDAASKLLSAPANARQTDIEGALARAVRFLEEPVAGASSVRSILMVSDGIDSRGRVPKPLPTGIQLLLISGGQPSTGPLADLLPLRFEAIEPAIAFMTVTAQQGASQ